MDGYKSQKIECGMFKLMEKVSRLRISKGLIMTSVHTRLI